MNLGQAIKQIRGNMRQRDFANLVGISQTYLTQIEKGHKNPNISIVNKITKVTGIPPAIIMVLGLEQTDLPSETQVNHTMLKSFIQAPLRELFPMVSTKFPTEGK